MQSWDPLSQACVIPHSLTTPRRKRQAHGILRGRGDLGGEPASMQWWGQAERGEGGDQLRGGGPGTPSQDPGGKQRELGAPDQLGQERGRG